MIAEDHDSSPDSPQAAAEAGFAESAHLWPVHVHQPKSHINASPTPHKVLYMQTLASLEEIFQKIFDIADSKALDYDETGHLPFAWLYQLDDEIVHLAQQHDTIPLMLLSCFAVLLKKLKAH